MKKRKLMGGFNRFRLILTLGVAVLLPAAALIVLNFYQLRSFKRDKVFEAAIQRDFQEWLLISEKKIDKKAIETVPMASFDQILQGRTPGLLVTSGSGAPGSAATG